MSYKARFSFHAPHKLLDTAHIYLGLTFKHCYMLELFISIHFILGKSWWFEKAKLIKHDQLTVCRWTLGRYFKKQKLIFNEQKNAPNVF